MSTTKRFCAAMLSVLLVLSLFTVVFAENSIEVSLTASDDIIKKSVSCEKNDTFSLYFAADELENGEDKLNSYQFTIWYNDDYLELVDGGIKDVTGTDGVLVPDESPKTDKSGKNTYKGYTVTFTSFEKGFKNSNDGFAELVEIPFKAKTIGTTNVYIKSEEIKLLPVVDSENMKKELACSVASDAVSVSVSSSSDSSGSFGGGATSSMAVKRTVIFNVDGAKSSVEIADGKKVTKPAAPAKEGYTFDGWYKDADFKEAYNFNDPVTESITLYAKFTKIPASDPVVENLPFTDIAKDDWAYEGIKYVYDNNMVKGISETLYGPAMNLTRATLVTLIYRMESEPEAPVNAFSDITGGAWYEKAVAWAAGNEIVLGVGEGLFAPDNNITREQIAVILYKYTKFKGGDVSKTADLAQQFTDADSVSSWAKDAVAWAVAEGLIKGKGEGNVAPADLATRAEIATVLMRYMK